LRRADWGYPIIAQDPIPDHLLSLAQRAVEDCPVLALAIRRAEKAKTNGS
jgi:ferredoxin